MEHSYVMEVLCIMISWYFLVRPWEELEACEKSPFSNPQRLSYG